MSSAQCVLVGAQSLEVNSVTAAAVIITVRLFSLATCRTAAATGVTGRSVIASTPPVSYHCRARLPATSGLFWVSPSRISIFLPSTVPPNSAAAMRAASTEPGPPLSA